MNRNQGEPDMKTYPSNNKRKIRKEEAHRPSLLRRAPFPGRGVLALAAVQLAFCMVASKVGANSFGVDPSLHFPEKYGTFRNGSKWLVTFPSTANQNIAKVRFGFKTNGFNAKISIYKWNGSATVISGFSSGKLWGKDISVPNLDNEVFETDIDFSCPETGVYALMWTHTSGASSEWTKTGTNPSNQIGTIGLHSITTAGTGTKLGGGVPAFKIFFGNDNSPPVIQQGDGPFSKVLSEDTTTTWIASDLNATDADTAAGSLTWSVSSAASNGTATVSGTGAAPSTFTYAPNANFNGTDSFAVQVSDGDQNDTVTVNVTVTSVNDVPVVANPLSDLSVTEDASNTTRGLGNVFIDADNTSITKSVTSSNPSLVTASVNGNVLTLDYQANQSGSATITVTGASNGQTVSDVFTVTVVPVADPPVITQGGIGEILTTIGGNSIAKINPSTGQGEVIGSMGVVGTHSAAFATDGSQTLYALIGNTTLATVNLSTGQATSVVNQGTGISMLPLEVATDGTIYGIGNSKILYRIDENNGSATPIGNTQVNAPMDLAFDSTGTLWATGTNKLWTVNTATGASTLQTSITGIQGGMVMGIMFDSNDVLYATSYVSNSPLYTINTETGAASIVAASTNLNQPHGGDFLDNPEYTLTLNEDQVIQSISATDLNATDSDTNASSLSWSLQTAASNGTATVSGTGASPSTFIYVPNANFNGSDSFVVQVSDGDQNDTITVNLTVSAVNDDPVVANAIADVTANEDAADATIALGNVFNDLDDDNASITKAANSSDASLVTATVNGNVLTLAYQANQSGTATITVTGTSNGQSVSDAFTVTVAAVNDAPVVANAIADATANEDAADATVALGNVFNDIDDDNASITKAANSSNASLVTTAVNGNTLTLDFQANQSGTATITVTGTSNGQSVSDAFTVTVSAVDDAPVVANAIADLSAAEDAADATIALAKVFNDIDDDNASITKAATSSDASLVTTAVNGNTLTLALQANQSGSATITVTGTSNGQSVSDAFDVTVAAVNDAPENLSLSGNEVPENKPAGTTVGNFSATDVDANATLAFSLVDGNGSADNAGFTLNANGALSTAGSLDFEAGSSLSIRVRVTDNDDASQEKAFAISVTNVVEDLDGDAIEDAFDDDDDGDGFSDAEEVAYGSDPMDAASVANQAPSGIALDNSDVIENSPAGTKIGDFLVSDPDDPNDSGAYVVALVAGNGSTDNNLFAIGSDGSLRTAAVLDFEAKAEHSIRVRVSDGHNASMEAVLAISATNSYAPIVRTLSPAVDGNGTIILGGTVLTDGGSPVLEVGVLTSDNLRFEDAVSLAATQSANFSVQASSLLPGARYYVRAFATNAEGTTLGTIKRFYTQEAASTPEPWWHDTKESAGGWRNSDWLGDFIPYDNGWLYHADLGWVYAIDDGASGLWVWKKNLGWLWTAKGAFPHLYRNDTKEWLYFLATKKGKLYFYNHATGFVE
jgi:hypothetical protein